MFALLIALLAIAGGTIVTYLYDREATFVARLCAGVCTGFAALGFAGFVVASFTGMRPLALALAAALVSLPLILLRRGELRERVRDDATGTLRFVRRAVLNPALGTTGLLLFYLFMTTLLWFVYSRAMFVSGGEVFTGVDNNLGDLPFHTSIITSFAYGENFPPEHPEYAGVRLTYPFMADFVSAIFLRAGASLESAFFWPNLLLALSLVCLLHRWALKLTREPAAAIVSPLFVLLNGGVGWGMLLREASESGLGLFNLLKSLPHNYSITSVGYRWGNSITSLFVPQRGFLLGLPLAIIVWTLWWQATEDEKEKVEGQKAKVGSREGDGTKLRAKGKKDEARRGSVTVDDESAASRSEGETGLLNGLWPMSEDMRRMVAAGVVAGLLPLVHAHSYVVMMGMGGCLALLFRERWREWAAFFAVALILAAPQMYWATRETGMRAESFFAWQVGWDRGNMKPVWFWFKNTGLFIPLLIAALAWRGREPLMTRKLLFFFAPFALCFIIPNVAKLSPSIWDNIKILFYWYVAAVPLVALLLARLWREGAMWRVATVGLAVSLMLAGSLDVWRVVSRASSQKIFDRDGVALAEIIKRETPPRSLILHAPTYNHPVFLTGRRSTEGYQGHLWTHGIDYAQRDADIRRIYAGGPSAESLIMKHGIDYVVVGPLERAAMTVNGLFFERYMKVGEAGAYRLYKTARR